MNDVQDVETIEAMAFRRGISFAGETSFRNVFVYKRRLTISVINEEKIVGSYVSDK